MDQRLVAQLLVDWNQSRASSLNQKQSRPRMARTADPAASETGSSAIALTAGIGSAAATPTATRGVAVPQVPRLEFFIAVVKYFCRSCLLTWVVVFLHSSNRADAIVISDDDEDDGEDDEDEEDGEDDLGSSKRPRLDPALPLDPPLRNRIDRWDVP